MLNPFNDKIRFHWCDKNRLGEGLVKRLFVVLQLEGRHCRGRRGRCRRVRRRALAKTVEHVRSAVGKAVGEELDRVVRIAAVESAPRRPTRSRVPAGRLIRGESFRAVTAELPPGVEALLLI